jgi:hypothetical protein
MADDGLSVAILATLIPSLFVGTLVLCTKSKDSIQYQVTALVCGYADGVRLKCSRLFAHQSSLSSKRAMFRDVSSGGGKGREMRFEIRSRFAKVGIEMEVEGKGLAALLE